VDHPSEETLKRFASGTASREEGKAVVAHLLKGCADCARKLRCLIDTELLEAMEISIVPKENLRSLFRGAPPARPEEKGKDED